MTRKLSKIIEWDQLRKIREIRFIKSMYIWLFIVPITAKALSKFSDVASITVFGHSFELILTLPFSWKLFYFSAVSFALANLIFQIKCPNIIKDHPNFAHFKSEGKQLKQLGTYSEELNYNWGSLAEKVEDKKRKYNRDIDVEDPQHYFWPIFEYAKKTYFSSRANAGLFYFVGLFLISIVILQNLYAVIKLI